MVKHPKRQFQPKSKEKMFFIIKNKGPMILYGCMTVCLINIEVVLGDIYFTITCLLMYSQVTILMHYLTNQFCLGYLYYK